MAALHQRPTQNGSSSSHNNGGMGNGTQAMSQPPANLCNYCHKWPKNPGHNFCSKTCANRAGPGTGPGFKGLNSNTNSRNVNPGNPNVNTTHNTNRSNGTNNGLCNFCHKKPKLPPHDFCGKTCATNAGAAPGSGGSFVHVGGGPAPPPPQPTQNQNQNQNRGGRSQGQGQGPRGQNGQNPKPIDPVEITKMVVDQIPYLKTFIPQNSPLLNGTTSSNSGSGVISSSNPRLPLNNSLGLAVGSPVPATANANLVSSPNGTTLHIVQLGNDGDDESLEGDECALAGCTNQKFIDSNGIRSSYCSQRHRQQAVASGMVEPCIMCGLNPQSDGDYFCSRECREDALNKLGTMGVASNDAQAN
ncbi:hypothetical protein K435DRAFT_972647 [Dendrothele bispora CBS 962.96]|uniref:Uncharacterized protein n=1 Tax=Dendrothele bispora (strain CBS 962.96) TaxID=1314807 RepID=A0A4S8KXK1_DENBC|nr:hypothetical protein K435DRAFT_972647 [Dendrothele bispora CBS 962.96]